MSHFHHIQAIKVLIKVKFFFNSIFICILDCVILVEQQTEGPSVDLNALDNDSSTKTLDPKKTTIGQRRAPQAKKVNI
jgi:hypothetical protein